MSLKNIKKRREYYKKYQNRRRRKARLSGFCTEHDRERKPCPVCIAKRERKRLSGECSNCTRRAISGKARCRNCTFIRKLTSLPELARPEARKAAKKFKGFCDSCGRRTKGFLGCFDHNHRTKKFRGILCDNCNVALGHAKDSIKILKKLIAYLKKRDVK